jgi:hypothetical protein
VGLSDAWTSAGNGNMMGNVSAYVLEKGISFAAQEGRRLFRYPRHVKLEN